MRNGDITWRPMRLEDVNAGLSLSMAEGWNQTTQDWVFLITDTNHICLAAILDDKIIGTIAAINYSNRIAWLGMVLVDKNHRGQGVSTTLLTEILKQVHECKSIKLDATPAGYEIYQKLDFNVEHLISRMILPSVRPDIVAEHNDLVPMDDQHLTAVIALDKFTFGADRSPLIRYLFLQHPSLAFMLERQDKVVGFSLGRPGYKYHHIGPVVAQSTADAKTIIANVLQRLIRQSVVIDVLNHQAELIIWLESIGFEPQRQFKRMYRKDSCINGNLNHQFLICGPEFG